MQWTKPEFKEITLGGELTAYANTDDTVRPSEERPARTASKTDADGSRDAA